MELRVGAGPRRLRGHAEGVLLTHRTCASGRTPSSPTSGPRPSAASTAPSSPGSAPTTSSRPNTAGRTGPPPALRPDPRLRRRRHCVDVDADFAVIRTRPPRDVVGVPLPLHESRLGREWGVTVIAIKPPAPWPRGSRPSPTPPRHRPHLGASRLRSAARAAGSAATRRRAPGRSSGREDLLQVEQAGHPLPDRVSAVAGQYLVSGHLTASSAATAGAGRSPAGISSADPRAVRRPASPVRPAAPGWIPLCG